MKRVALAALLALLSISVFAQNNFTVEVERVVSVDEAFRVVFVADGKVENFSWSGADGLDIIWGPQSGSSRSTSIVNGKRTTSYSETYSYVLQATGTGHFTIPSATATIEGKQYSTRAVEIEVVGSQGAAGSAQQDQTQGRQDGSQQGGGVQADPATGQKDVFLQLSLSKYSVVKGEPVTATLKIYTRTDIAGFEDIKFPTFNGFWSQELDAPQNLSFERENVNGTIYQAALVRRYSLVPQQTGKIEIDPAEMICLVRARVANSGPRSIFDDFFGDSYQTVRKKIETRRMTVDVKPLPSGAPASFGGGVGSYTMNVRMAADSICTHEASSITITINGRGNVALLEAPKVTLPPDFEIYDMKTTDDIQRSSGGTSGSKTFELPFIARSQGEFTIPPIQYSYYDVAAGRYVTLSSEPLAIKVTKGDDIAGAGVAQMGFSKQAVQDLNSDIRYIATGDLFLRENGRFLITSPLMYILATLIVILFFAAGALMRRSIVRASDVAGVRNRKASKVARARLRQAQQFLRQGLLSAFYEELHKALLGYIGDKLSIPVSELSKQNISEALAHSGAGEGLASQFISILDECEYARYAPDAGQEAMEKHYQQAVEVISGLEGNLRRGVRNAAKTAVIALFAAMTALQAYAAETPEMKQALSSAEAAYASGDWEVALSGWQSVERSGMTSPALMCNIGDCWYKMGETGRAVLYYERALKLDPSYDDAKANLAIAQMHTLDRIDSVPEFFLKTWIRNLKYSLSSNAWAVAALALLAFGLALMLCFRFLAGRGARVTSFVLAMICFLSMLCCTAFSFGQKRSATSGDAAVVTSGVASVKSSPDAAGTSLFVIHEGLRVDVLDHLGSWTRIQLADGRQGWAESSSLETI